jgi:hypothetical protein
LRILSTSAIMETGLTAICGPHWSFRDGHG